LQYRKQVLCHSGCVRYQRTDQTGWPIDGESAGPVAQCGKTDPLCEVLIGGDGSVVHDGSTVRPIACRGGEVRDYVTGFENCDIGVGKSVSIRFPEDGQ
jgi:hypothetical protein